jgi:hypothetical protein
VEDSNASLKAIKSAENEPDKLVKFLPTISKVPYFGKTLF